MRGCVLGLGPNDSLSAEEGFWTGASSLGAVTSSSGLAGTARVATLTIHVAGVPGTYHLRLAYGGYGSSTDGATMPMQTGQVFEIHVGGQ